MRELLALIAQNEDVVPADLRDAASHSVAGVRSAGRVTGGVDHGAERGAS
jgi:hypothetical protein